jgi:hypothetical protein
MKVATSRLVEADRTADCSNQAIADFFAGMEKRLTPSLFAPELTFNVDETMLAFSTSKSLVVIPRTQKAAMSTSTKLPAEHITLVLCVDAAGGHLQTTCILPLKNLPKSLDSLSHNLYMGWTGIGMDRQGRVSEQVVSARRRSKESNKQRSRGQACTSLA